MVLRISCASLGREMNKISPPAAPGAPTEAEAAPDPRLITRFASSGG